ncbi:WYL domain-containing protein [Ferriphaselus sp. R-1]|uniref:helix-turn-helix transcriptional regulator n=1 Tax=Ferriphaselus sp. R-1 TaxID=1485544 RepID=UPI001F2E0C34|nr:WYL domain-containing protein [Ferriphaselus sp. R-1]
MMLVKLNQGEKLDLHDLADEFGVNVRTVQRDINERFAYLPIQRSGTKYHLDPAYLGKLTTRDIERFAGLAGVRGLFPSLSDEFMRDIFDARIQSALLVKGHSYESLAGKEQLFRELEQAIIARRHIAFDYSKADGIKRYQAIAPFKLMNHKGIWYLAARDGDKLKTYSFAKIAALRLTDTHFEPAPSIDQRLAEEDGIWMGEEKKEIVLKISREVASYFKRRKLIANQVIEKELEDGGLILSAKVGHVNQVLPIVRYWIPNIRIISPEGLQEELERELKAYVERVGSLV